MKLKKNQDKVVDVFEREFAEGDAREVVMSGRLNIGKSGNPVTITVEDEVTGEVMEISNVSSALLMIEEARRSSSGWMSLIFGDLKKIEEVLEFLSKISLAGLKKMQNKD